MASDISVGIGVLGEKEFKKALEECQNSLKQLDSGLKANAAEFGKTDDAIKESAERVALLRKAYDESEKQVKALGDAVEWSKKEYGELSRETTRYVVAQNKARENAARFARELEEADNNMLELGRDSGRVGRQLEQGIGEAADDVSRKFDSMVNKLDENLIEIRNSVELSALADVGGMLSDGVSIVVDAVGGLTEGTLEYRRQMAILEQNAKDMGFDPDWLKQQAIGIATLTGDMDGAIEAAANLARVAPDMDSFTMVMNRLLGAAIAWPETLKIENLAESLQESLMGGMVTGAYSEMLTRLGIDIEKVNKSIQDAIKKDTDSVWNAGTAWTSEHGFEETIEEFRRTNAEMLAYNKEKYKLTQAEAALAEKLTPAATVGIEMFTSLIDGITNMIEKYDAWWQSFMRDSEMARQTIAEVNEQTAEFTSVDQFTEEIAKADAEGAYARSMALMEARERFHQAQIENQQKQIEEENKKAIAEAYGMGEQTAQAAEQSVLESIGRSMIGDYWYEYFFGEEDELKKDAEQMGKDIATQMSDGLDAYAYQVINSIRGIVQQMQAVLNNNPLTVNVQSSAQGAQTGAGSTPGATVTLNMDGKKVAEGTMEYTDAAGGSAVERAKMYVY